MNILGIHIGRQASLQREIEAGVQKSVSSLAQAFLRGDDGGSSGGATISNPFQQSVWVHGCVSLLADSVAGLDLYFEQDDQPIEKHPLVDLFKRPHPQLNGFSFWKLIEIWRELRGEAFVVCTDDANNVLNIFAKASARQIRRMHVLPPDCFREVVQENRLLGWQFTGTGNTTTLGTQTLLPEEVIHLPIVNPFNPWRGLSPLSVARIAAATDYASAQFQKGLMMNNADTGVIVRTDQQLDETQREMLLAALKERKRSAGTADRPLLLWGGAEVVKPTLSATDMQFLENRKFNRQEICAAFRVPQELLGFTEDANRSVGDAARQNFLENRIAPLCDELVASFAPLLALFGQGISMEFAIEDHPVMQAARRARFTTAKDVFSTMGIPVKVLDDVFDLGLPDLPHGDKVFLPFSLQEYGAESPQITQSPLDGGTAPAAPVSDQAKEDPAAKLLKALKLLTPSPISETPSPASHVCSQSTDYEAAIAGSVKNKKGKLSKFFFEQRARVLTKLEAQAAKSAKVQSRNWVDDLFDLVQEDASILGVMQPLLKGDLNFGVAQIGKELSVPLFDVPPSRALEFLKTRQNVITDINRTTFDAIKGSLSQGLESGDTQAQLADRVKAVFNTASQSRAETIALTETNVAINSGRFEGMQQARVEAKAWLSSHLETSRPAHLKAEGDYEAGIPVEEPFVVDGEEMLHPGDPKASPGNTINCKCALIAVLGGKAVKAAKHLRFEEWTQEAKP